MRTRLSQRRVFRSRGLMSVLVLSISAAAGVRADSLIGNGNNLAAGTKAEFTIPPNYSLTTDSEYCDEYDASCDAWDLTDGYIYDGLNKIWAVSDTVGWSSPETPVGVHFDLGSVQAIDAFTFDTGGGASGAFLPASLSVFVSDDGAEWHYATSLRNESVPQHAYIQHQLIRADVHTAGRFVAIYAIADGAYVFCDEIEIFGGDYDPSEVTFNDDPIAAEDLAQAALDRIDLDVEMTASVYLIGAAEVAIASVEGGDSESAQSVLDAVFSDVVAQSQVLGTGRENGLPYTSFDQETCEIVGQFMYDSGLPGMQVWEYTDSTRPLLPFDRPTSSFDGVILQTHMMGNEFEQVSFCVSNNSAQEMVFDVSVSADETAPSVDFYEGVFVLAPGYQYIDDAIPPISETGVTVPPGMTKEVIVELNSAGVESGTYEIEIVVAGPFSTESVFITADVYYPVMPSDRNSDAAVWGYFGTDLALAFPQEVAADLDNHGISAQSLNTYEIPYPKYGDDGELILPDASRFVWFDESIGLRPNAEQWFVMATIEGTTLEDLLETNNASFFQDWVLLVRDNFQDHGISTDDWAFMFVDEPSLSDWEEIVVPLATWVKAVDPDIRILQNWNHLEVEEAILAEGYGLIDIAMPTSTRMKANAEVIADFMNDLPMPGWIYDSTSSPSRDPFADYRLMLWDAWDLGVQGAGKWVYNENEIDLWNDFYGHRRSLIYDGPEGPIRSKRWQAWRDGQEDYELLSQLAFAADATGNSALNALLDDVDDILADRTNHELLLEWRADTLEAIPPEDQMYCEGDVNRDGSVDPLDSGQVLSHLGCAPGNGKAKCDQADANGDGEIDVFDLGFVSARMGNCSE